MGIDGNVAQAFHVLFLSPHIDDIERLVSTCLKRLCPSFHPLIQEETLI